MRRNILLIAALIAIGSATLFPHPGELTARSFLCLSCVDTGGTSDFLLNILLFVPLGIGLCLAGYAPLLSLLVIAGTTFSIEALQFLYITGRDATIRDCLANTLGGIVGYGLQPHLITLLRPNTRTAARLAWGAAGVWIGHAALVAVAFHPSMTMSGYYGQLAPRLGGFGVFRGTIQGATINGTDLPDGPLPASTTNAVRSADHLELKVTVTPGRLPGHLAPIISVADGEGNEIALVGQQLHDLVFRSRLVADRLGLRTPDITLADVFPVRIDAGQTSIAIVASRVGRTLDLRATFASRETRVARLTLTPSLGWTLWSPFDVPQGAAFSRVTWLWLGLPLATIAMWSALGFPTNGRRGIGKRLAAAAPSVTATVGALVVVPLLFDGSSTAGWSELMASGLGTACGFVIGRVLAHARDRSFAYGGRGRKDGRVV